MQLLSASAQELRSDRVKPDTPHGTWIHTDVPTRLDALGWSRWHRRVIIALGITWILDGLEASLIANLAPTLEHADTLGLTGTEVGFASSVFLMGVPKPT